MPQQGFKKTSMMRQVESRHPGQDIKAIVTDALRDCETLEAAAQQLGVSEFTLCRKWMPAMGIRIERTIVVT